MPVEIQREGSVTATLASPATSMAAITSQNHGRLHARGMKAKAACRLPRINRCTPTNDPL